jgi:hypothetical protein
MPINSSRLLIAVADIPQYCNIFTCMEYSLLVFGLNLCYCTALGQIIKIKLFNFRCYTKLFIFSSGLLNWLYVTCNINSYSNDIPLSCKWFLNLIQMQSAVAVHALSYIHLFISLRELCFSC